MAEVIERWGLPSSLYTDRGSHYWTTPEAGGKVDRDHPTQFGRAMRQLGVEMIPAYSPEARGRCERMFATHQERLPKELAAHGIDTMAEANRYLAEHYRTAFNEQFSVPAAEPGTAFVPFIGPGLADILCEHHERTVGRDNCVSFERKRLQIPAHTHRCHFIKARDSRFRGNPSPRLAGRLVVARTCRHPLEAQGCSMGRTSMQTPYRMDDYERAVAEHRPETPAAFNFGADVVDAWARDPSKLALVWCDARGSERRLTFDEVARTSNRVANRLAARGVAKGDRVVVMLPRIPEWQIALTACLKLGAIPIPCITMLTERDVGYRVRHSGAVAAITLGGETGKFADAAAFKARIAVGSPSAGWEAWQDTGAESDAFEPAAVAAEDPAIMYYTSGSTGAPKGVLHAARGLHAWRMSARYWLSLAESDTMWCTADTGWSKAGTSIFFGPWSQGSAVLFHDGPFDARRRFELMERYRVTVFCAAATELRRLVLEDVSGLDLSALRLAVSAGESVNPEIIDAWKRSTGVDLLDGYGQTETLMTVLNYPGMPVKPGSMGRPLPGVEAAVLDERGRLRARDARGRLLIRAPNPQLMLGYWNDPERTGAQYVEVGGSRWFVTGDTVDADEDGYLFYFGRDDDVIGSSGYRIGPQEVENALIEHPAVQESAVVGLPDPDRGQVVAAFVIPAPGFETGDALMAELQEHVKRITAPYKYPRRIEFVESLPKTVSGKIQRGVLRRAYS